MADQGNFGGGNFGSGSSSMGAGNGKIADKLHNVVDQASDKASDFASRARSSYDSARSSVDGWLHDLSAVMERRPIATLFVGIGVGYLFAKLRGRG
ncbi:MAG TPA: hypothetical protein VL463_26080 [Kofleriaceae bacterium]|nr:hypothetical protein [Kofleriaceae bacterium]